MQASFSFAEGVRGGLLLRLEASGKLKAWRMWGRKWDERTEPHAADPTVDAT